MHIKADDEAPLVLDEMRKVLARPFSSLHAVTN